MDSVIGSSMTLLWPPFIFTIRHFAVYKIDRSKLVSANTLEIDSVLAEIPRFPYFIPQMPQKKTEDVILNRFRFYDSFDIYNRSACTFPKSNFVNTNLSSLLLKRSEFSFELTQELQGFLVFIL